MSRIKKHLHFAQSMCKLEELTKIPNLDKKNPIQIAKSSKTVLEKADSEYLEGDEEMAYLYYMKYFQLIALLKHSSNHGKDKQEIRNIIGNNTAINNTMDRLENLKTSLISRYNERSALNDIKAKSDSKVHKDDDSHKPINGTVIEGGEKWINSESLHRIMTDDDRTILLLDCRERKEYEESRIDFKNIINIPQVRKGLSAFKLRDQIDDSTMKYLFDRRTEMDLIVLIDWDESQKNQCLSKPIWDLYDVLTKWDPHATYKSKPRVLDGGFSEFLIHYPMMATNPKYKKNSNKELNHISVEEIEYPNVFDIKMKAKAADGSPKPRIDRTNKALAKRKYEDARRPSIAIDVVKEKEMKFEQAIEKEHEVISIANELENVMTASVKVNDPHKKKEWFDKRTELGNKLVQKESELNDTVRELESDEPLELENHPNQTVQPESLARLQEKKSELLKMEKFRHEKKEGIEQKWRLTAEQQKRHHEIEEEHKRPKMPTFDRSVKPINQRPQIQRDFSPVPGSYGAVGATGLKNLGNTCYMNSIIQCLLNLEPLCSFLKDGAYKHYINYKSETQGTITEELAMVCSEIWSGKYKSISPKCLRYAIGQNQKMFRGYDQQDSHEFLTIFIDILNSELQYSIEIAPNEKLNAPDRAWREFVKNKDSFIQQMFFGQIRSTLKCFDCQRESPTFEGFSNLSLELPNNDRGYDLYDCLDSYFDGEYIDGWTCPKCEKNRKAVKKLDISKLPEILVIHLKRFHVNLYSSSNTYQKKQNYVDFPIKDFNIKDYITRSASMRQQSFNYDLCAVSNHYGTMERGHYTAFCKNHTSKCWYKFDDNYVTQISINEVISSAAYILFYVRN